MLMWQASFPNDFLAQVETWQFITFIGIHMVLPKRTAVIEEK